MCFDEDFRASKGNSQYLDTKESLRIFIGINNERLGKREQLEFHNTPLVKCDSFASFLRT